MNMEKYRKRFVQANKQAYNAFGWVLRSEKEREENPIRFMEDYCKFGSERVYLLMAIARTKDNPLSSSEEIAFREVIRNKREIQEKYSKLKSIVNDRAESEKSYNFRLHLSVNARNTTKT